MPPTGTVRGKTRTSRARADRGAVTTRAEIESREQHAFEEGKPAVSGSAAFAAEGRARKLRDEHFDPTVAPVVVDLDADPEIPAPVEPVLVGEDSGTQRRIRASAAKVEERREASLEGPLAGNVLRPPSMARDDLIRDGEATTDQFRAAASEANQEEALDDLHLRRVHRLPDEEVGRQRAALRAARNERAEEIVRREARVDSLEEIEKRLRDEGDSLATNEPDYVTRARNLAESQAQAEATGAQRRTPMTPEPHRERGMRPEER
jgi:hypothetical protein